MQPIIIKYKKEHGIRERILLFLLGGVIRVHAYFYGNRQPWNLSTEDLIQYPEGSLGNKLGIFLRKEELQPVPKIERHDAFHILFDFTTHIYDESAMQFFLLGNGKISPFTLSTAAFTALMLPDQWNNFYVQFRRGRKTQSIAKWNYKELLHDDFSDLKKVINHKPVNNESLLKKLVAFNTDTHRAI